MAAVFEEVLKNLGNSASVYIVGGMVRDELLGLTSKDVDVVVSLPLGVIEEKLKELGFSPHRIGAHMQTVSLFQDGARLDIAEFTDLNDDALRRDFTINALYRSVQTGALKDPLAGQADLNDKRLRACGNPAERFQEDPVRILRMIRFAVKYDLGIEEETWASGKAQIRLLESVASERITEELGKILLLKDTEKALRLLDELGYFESFIPELSRLKGLTQNRYHNKDAWEHTLHVTKNTPPNLLLRLAGLFHDIGKWEVASKECWVYGKLKRTPGGFEVAGFRVVGKQLNQWNQQIVQIRGARLDHYPHIIQVKSIRRGPRGQAGFEWIADGKRHFLGHEKESARLLKQILSRFKWNMVLEIPGSKGESELLKLVENHMIGTLVFMNELRGEGNSSILLEKTKRFAWDIGWDGRTYSPRRVQDLLDLWKADFHGGKQREAGDNERFAKIQAEVLKAAAQLEIKHQSLNWDEFALFIEEKGLKGEAIGQFKDQIRRKVMLEDQWDPLDKNFLNREFQLANKW